MRNRESLNLKLALKPKFVPHLKVQVVSDSGVTLESVVVTNVFSFRYLKLEGHNNGLFWVFDKKIKDNG